MFFFYHLHSFLCLLLQVLTRMVNKKEVKSTKWKKRKDLFALIECAQTHSIERGFFKSRSEGQDNSSDCIQLAY